MDKKKYQNMTREELIAELEKRERYYKMIVTATRHYAFQLLDELKKLNKEND